jgi:hypothetical protein
VPSLFFAVARWDSYLLLDYTLELGALYSKILPV